MTTIYEESVQSVKRRGFYDSISSDAFRNAMLMAQFARLIEEIGEYEEAVRSCASRESIVSELADVVIVASQIGHITGEDFSDWVKVERTKIPGCALVQLAGQWARATRKNNDVAASNALMMMIVWCRTAADQRGVSDFDTVIREKLAADEQRGYQHNGGVADGA